jgi:hypothetical protein
VTFMLEEEGAESIDGFSQRVTRQWINAEPA